MNSKTNIKLSLSSLEKQKLRCYKLRIKDIPKYAPDELEVLLGVSFDRARKLYALAVFQLIPSIGIKFAENLVSMGYYSLKELKGKDGAKLTEEFELLKGYWIDPCVEDQFRLVVHYAKTRDERKKWWDFTEERKKFRLENGYPANRPSKSWFEN